MSNSIIKGGSPTGAMRDVEMGVEDANKDNKLKACFGNVDAIKNDMEKAKQLLLKLQAANEEGKTIQEAQAIKALRERMDQDVQEVFKKVKSIRKNLEDLDNASLANRSWLGCEFGTPGDTSMTNSLRKKLKDLMEEFQVLRHQIMVDYKETVRRRYYTVIGQHADEGDVEEIMKTGESENFLQKAIQDQGRDLVMDTIWELQERHNGTKEIEQNLFDLHHIFLGMSEVHGEQMNDIQHHLSRASEQGTQQLKHAKHYQSKYMVVAIMTLWL